MAAVRRLEGQILTQNDKNTHIHVSKIRERHFINFIATSWLGSTHADKAINSEETQEVGYVLNEDLTHDYHISPVPHQYHNVSNMQENQIPSTNSFPKAIHEKRKGRHWGRNGGDE